MASFRPFAPPPPLHQQPSFMPPPPPPPNPNPLPPPPPNPSHHPYPQHGGGPSSGSSSSYPPNYGRIPPNPNPQHGYGGPSPHQFNTPRTQHHQHQYPYQPPSLPSSSYSLAPAPPQPTPLPRPPVYYSSSSQYPSQYDPPSTLPPPPPPPPSSPPPPPPPSSSLPPPPLPPLVPPQQLPASTHPHNRVPNFKEGITGTHTGEAGHLKSSLPPRQQKGSYAAQPPAPVGKAASQVLPNGPYGKVETEEERRIRKKREYEKQRQEEKRQHMLKQSQATVLQKTQMLSSGMKAHGSMAGSRMAERRTSSLLGGERVDNRLKKPTTFLCKLKFRNELPDPTAQPKLLVLNTNKDRYTKYAITSLEKLHKPKLYLEPDLGIPLDLLDINIYNPPVVRPPLDPEDEELLRDVDVSTPIKQDGIRRKDRPTDKGVSWLVKTQYISPLSMESAKLSITEKQAKELRETREGRNIFLEGLNNREKQIQAIEESFKVSKLRPVHQANRKLEPVEILPLLPDFDRYDDRFVMITFDGDPTTDSEIYSKLDHTVRDDHESQAIMKSFVVNGSDPANPEKCLAYMVPAPDELSKDMYDENEEISYSWIREYNWDVRADDADDPTTYLVNFDEDAARYLPLPTKIVLRKRRTKEGRSGDEIEHYPVPSRVAVRRRSAVSVGGLNEPGGMSSNHDYESTKVGITNSKRVRSSQEDSPQLQHKVQRVEDMDHFSEEEDMSD